MWSKIKKFVGKFIFCLPIVIMMLASLYYVNLFNQLRNRDLDRQLEEKHQFMKYVLDTKDQKRLNEIIATLYTMPNTNTYLLDENLDRVAEKYYNLKPLVTQEAPYKDKNIRALLLSNDHGVFKHNLKPDVYMYWDYRWLDINGKKRLILIGVRNYPFGQLDNELQISIGILLLLTSLLNWILVGYGKCLYQKEKRFRLLNEGKTK